MATWNLIQTRVHQPATPNHSLDIGRFFARLNGTDGIDLAAQQRQNRATDGRLSPGEGLNRAHVGR